jgi:hypothetical protein
MKTKFFGKDGTPIHGSEWMKLREDRGYRVIREYRNDDVWLELLWEGKVDDPSVFRDCWKMFQLTVANCNSKGEWKADPVENGKWFGDQESAIKAYEAFLERWTLSRRNEDGKFVEEDNELTPPPPPDPDAPSTDIADIESVKLGDDDVGVW